MHTESLDAEDLVRGLGYASRISRAAGKELPRDAKMTDVPCHTWFLATLLKHAGVDFLHIGCNPASRSPLVPPLFWWEGPDGSRLLTMYTEKTYGTEILPPADWPYKTWLALLMTAENQGPPRPSDIETYVDRAKQQLPGVRVRVGRLSDFGDAISGTGRPARGPRRHARFVDSRCDVRSAGHEDGPQRSPLDRRHRGARYGASCVGPNGPNAPVDLAAVRESSLLYGEHTWGGALWWIGFQLSYGDAWKARRATASSNGLKRPGKSTPTTSAGPRSC